MIQSWLDNKSLGCCCRDTPQPWSIPFKYIIYVISWCPHDDNDNDNNISDRNDKNDNDDIDYDDAKNRDGHYGNDDCDNDGDADKCQG